MPNLLIVFLSIFLLFIFFIYKKPYNRSTKENNILKLIATAYGEKYNPDFNTNNWDLHKIRLNKFGRSQYKGLTFFKSTENRIYYFSEKGTKIYC